MLIDRATYSNVQGWTGVDGALLKPVVPLLTEDLPDLLKDLEELACHKDSTIPHL